MKWQRGAHGLLTVLALCAIACGGADPSGGAQDRSDQTDSPLAPVDLAFLLPLPPAGSGELPMVPISTTGSGGRILGIPAFTVVFDALDKFQGARVLYEPDAQTVYQQFYVTAIRFAPCGDQSIRADGQPIAPSECEPRLRLVVQPWLSDDESFDDAGFHLIYAVKPGDKGELVAALVEFRDACNGALGPSTTQGTPIGPHPCLAGLGTTDGAARAQARALLDGHVIPLLKRFAGERDLHAVTAMLGSNDGAENLWEWRMFDVAKAGGTTTLAPVAEMPHNPGTCLHSGGCSPSQMEELDRMSFHEDGFYLQRAPTSTIAAGGRSLRSAAVEKLTLALVDARFASDPDRSPLLSGSLFDDKDAREGLLAATALANPRLVRAAEVTGDGGVDCVNCHVQGAVLTILKEKSVFDALDPGLRDELAQLRYPAGDDPGNQLLPAARDFYMTMLKLTTEQFVINFGYFGRSPSINPITVHQAIDAAAHVNLGLDGGRGGHEKGRHLIISEYVHGRRGKRALELFNSSTGDLDASSCTVNIYFNGGLVAHTVPLQDPIPAGGTLLLCEGVSALRCNQAALRFNGNDVIEVECAGTVVDGIGRRGSADSWGQRTTLRRKCSALFGAATAEQRAAIEERFTALPGVEDFSSAELGVVTCD